MKVDAATRRTLVEIGTAIRTARERAKISQAALAAAIGMQRENLIRVEKGRVNLTVETIVRITTGLGAEVSLRIRPKRRVRGAPR